MRHLLLGATALASLVGSAGATTISGILTADDGVAAYISTVPGTLGTLAVDGLATYWGSYKTFSGIALTPGVTNYLQIIARDDGAPGMFVGGFTLSDTNFHFANNTQTLVSDTTNWLGAGIAGSNAWVAPAGTVSLITNYNWGVIPLAYSAAQYVWATDSQSGGAACGSCYVALIAEITPAAVTAPSPTAVPEPLSAGLLGAGLLGLGLVRRRG